MASTSLKRTPSSRQYCDERSPNTMSHPIRIPSTLIYKPFPPILMNEDSTPGLIHHGRAATTDFTMWHFPSKIISDEEKITSNRAAPCWVDRVGMAPRPGCELKTVKKKEVEMVRQLFSPWDNKREIDRLKEVREDKMREKRKKREDEGYESAGGPEAEGVYEKKTEGDKGDFSVWSC
ncbi:hypothetical protein SVAN01_10809 [Stagonosporopsis vannaccii]|nr:hypothetical protein SVAN01_10809 [Stagonosporopsis vannaccii]